MFSKSVLGLAVLLSCWPGPGLHAARPATRWYGARPHTPLAIVDGKGIRSAGQRACAPWSAIGSRWRAVDAYGQVTGRARVKSRDRYDVTRCEEVELALVDGQAGVGLFVAENGAWRPSPSSQWTPSEAQRGELERLHAQLRATLTADPPAGPLPALYFRVPGREGSVEHAVIGGRILLIARLEAGRWRLAYLANQAAAALPAEAFRPLAVFDMDDDGTPEVIFHLDAGDSWSDVVLGADGSGAWQQLAESIHGASA